METTEAQFVVMIMDRLHAVETKNDKLEAELSDLREKLTRIVSTKFRKPALRAENKVAFNQSIAT